MLAGDHGYDNRAADMRATFIAAGPDFRRGVRIGAFDNVDVYPLLARLLGLAPGSNDGDATLIDEALAPAGERNGG